MSCECFFATFQENCKAGCLACPRKCVEAYNNVNIWFFTTFQE
jgi:hypothetical protein